jgi:hypothetical protein
MKPRNWLIGVSHIGMVLVLELWFSARSSSQGSSHSVNGLPLAAALLTVAAGYRVSGFVQGVNPDSPTARSVSPVFPYLQNKWCSAAKRRRPDTIGTALFVGSN